MIARYALGALGIAAIAAGGLQVIENWDQASPFGLAAFLIAVIVLDDLILIPLDLTIGWAVTRYVPSAARPPVQAALVVFTGLAVIAIPFALSPARDGEHGTLLTEPYARNLALLAGLLAISAATVATLRRPSRPLQQWSSASALTSRLAAGGSTSTWRTRRGPLTSGSRWE